VKRRARKWRRDGAILNLETAELIEMLYQLEKPFVVNSDKIERKLGLTCTPLPQALQETVAWVRAQI
jgi:nucleoside-diphosphate-sugar epimerase